MMRYIQKKDCEIFKTDNEWMIFNSNEFMVTTVNEVGGFCWSLLREECSISEMVQAINKQYVLEEPIEKDIELFLSNLMDCGLIEHAS